MNGDFCDHLGCLQWIFLFKLPSDFGFFQERTSIPKESIKASTATDAGLISAIWEQKVYLSDILSDADIYWYNKITHLLLIALCLLLIPCCSLLFVYNSMLLIVECLEWGTCMLGVNTNVSVI